MFEPTGLGATIFRERYARSPEETWQEGCQRVAKHVAQAEENGNVTRFTERFAEQLVSNRFNPGGRIWYGSGRPKAQLLNCLDGATLVHTVDGLVPAKDLAGRTVSVLSEGGVYRSSSWHCYGEQPLSRVVFTNGDEILATPGHQWIVTKPKGGTERVKTSDLVGRQVPMQHRWLFNYQEDDYGEGVRHGLAFGDGAVISYGTSVELRQFGDSREMVPRFFDEHREAHYGQPTTVASRLPLHYKRLPEGTESQSYLRGFIAGWIGADGCVDTRGHVMLHNKHRANLEFARGLASLCGLPTTSIRLTRSLNPWTGGPSTMYKLTFVKAGMYDDHMIIKQAHRDKMFASPKPTHRATMRVESVEPTGEVREVFCCVEGETHSFVIGAGYLTGNCFVVPTEDSREGWGKVLSDTVIISSLMGGVGINLSPARGRGSEVKGTGGVSTGAVSLGSMINGVGDVIVGGGGRRMALMLCLNVNHPDIEEFLDYKLDLGKLNNANVSVVLPPDLSGERFQEMVRNAEEIPLVFGGVPSGKTINARWLWDRLVENAWKGGEPGVLNGHLANQTNSIFYAETLIATNPCGEIWLEPYGSCCLGSLVLPQFVKHKQGSMTLPEGFKLSTWFDWDALDESVRLAVRFLDNVLSVNQYPLPEIKTNNEKFRRIGLGVMGLHTMLLELGMRYDDEASFEFVDRLFAFIKNTAYDASINLAIEKGPFPGYDPQFLDSGFVKTLKRGLRNKIKEHGIRNCAVLTVPPTGTTSMVSGVSSGIEPLPPAVYWRNYFKPTLGGERELTRELVVEEAFTKYPDLVQSAIDIPVEAHFRMQACVQAHVDNAVSKTINMAHDFPKDAFGDIWLKYLPVLKGTTVYRYGSRDNEPIQPVPRSDWDAVVAANVDISAQEMTVNEFMSLDCVDGSCELGFKEWASVDA